MKVKHFTQTSLDPGNCWQTAVACLLDVSSPDVLPPQHEIETEIGYKVLDGYHRYTNSLNAYLIKHHQSRYFELPKWQAEGLFIHNYRPCVATGPTVRSVGDRADIDHAIVVMPDKSFWDPHPSRAGLTEIKSYGFIVPVDFEYLDPESADYKRRALMMETGKEGYKRVFGCMCPKCDNLEWFRQQVKEFQ